MKATILFIILSLPLFFTGCGESVSKQNSQSEALITKASEAESRGDYKTAISIYRQISLDAPKMSIPRFALARLLQDNEKDYIGAIYNYQIYLDLQSESDKNSEKAKIVKSRIEASRNLLAAQYANRLIEKDRTTLVNERNQIAKQLADAEQNTEKTKRELDSVQTQNVALQNRIVELQKLVESMKTSTSNVPKNTKFDKSEIVSTIIETKTVAEDDDIANIRSDAKRMIEEIDGGAGQQKDAVAEIKKTETMVKKPRQYTVKPGDTLYEISKQFYGKGTEWKKIRDANRERIDTNGRLLSGQVLIIP